MERDLSEKGNTRREACRESSSGNAPQPFAPPKSLGTYNIDIFMPIREAMNRKVEQDDNPLKIDL